jgi:hypothetical protein
MEERSFSGGDDHTSGRIFATNSQPNHYANTIVGVHSVRRCGWTHEEPRSDYDSSTIFVVRAAVFLGRQVGFHQVDEAEAVPLIGVILAIWRLQMKAVHSRRSSARARKTHPKMPSRLSRLTSATCSVKDRA